MFQASWGWNIHKLDIGRMGPRPKLADQTDEVSVGVSALAFATSHSSKAVLVANLPLMRYFLGLSPIP